MDTNTPAALMGANDEEGNGYQYDTTSPSNRLKKVTHPEGNILTYGYDGRGNVKSVTRTPKPGSPLPATVESADYDAVCVYPAKCNKPNWTRDALYSASDVNHQTDFTYDNVHGGITLETAPPDSLGRRAQKRYEYTQLSAHFKTATGVTTGSPIWLLAKQSSCANSVAASSLPASGLGCTGSDEIVTTYDYEPNNLFLRGVKVTTPDGTHLTCYAYDALGNKISETTPNANLGTNPGNCP